MPLPHLRPAKSPFCITLLGPSLHLYFMYNEKPSFLSFDHYTWLNSMLDKAHAESSFNFMHVDRLCSSKEIFTYTKRSKCGSI